MGKSRWQWVWLSLIALGCSEREGLERALRNAPQRSVYTPKVGPKLSPVAEPAPVASPAESAAERPAFHDEGIRYVVESAIARGQLPGAVVAVGGKDGVEYVQAFGQRTEGEPMTVDTVFDLASLTKPMATASAIMLLAERGVIDLSAPAANYLSELNTKDKRGIRISQLLLHTSGLPKVCSLSALENGRVDALRHIAGLALNAAPGERFDYSDLGYILLGEVVERVTGAALDKFVQQQMFEPLGMRSTRYLPKAEERGNIAPTEERDGVTIRGEVDDPRAYRLGGVAGHAGLFSTANDVARYAQMLLQQGRVENVRLLSEQSVQHMVGVEALNGASRTLGFDVKSSYSHGRGQRMSARAFGHGGYTGTSLWIDPERDLFVVLLSNRVHVGDKGSIHPLASSVADLAIAERERRADEATIHVGLEVMAREAFARVRGRNVGLVSHAAATTDDGKTALDLLLRAEGVTVKAVFTPEHGFAANAEGHIAHGKLAGLPMFSLFGKSRKPQPKMLNGIDTIVIDLVDVGTRFYTYMATALAVMEAASELNIDVILLDRPNPLDGVHVEGPVSEESFASFVNYYPLPLRHGMTAGELARLLHREKGLTNTLHVTRVTGWKREQWFGETELTWTPPSPNLKSPEQAMLYPAVGLVEGTNLSVGRGTDSAFRVVGAPFIESHKLVEAMSGFALAGVSFAPIEFRPTVGPYAGHTLPGVQLSLEDPKLFSAARTGLALIEALHTLYPGRWDVSRLSRMVGHERTLQLALDATPLSDAESTARETLNAFVALRDEALLYPEAPLSANDGQALTTREATSNGPRQGS